MVRRLKSSAAALYQLHLPEQFVWGNWKIVLIDAVAASNQMRRLRIRGLLHGAVSNEPAVARIEHDLPNGDFLKFYVLNREDVTGLDCGSHAGSFNTYAGPSKVAHKLPD
jgi:hypothetical protein